jgi:hypothetical protein
MTESAINPIAAVNDQFRQTFIGGTVLMTEGVQALEPDEQQRLIASVKAFELFTEDNDPYGEHDFGSITLDGKSYFWKIDCYDLNLQYASENPADPAQTKRVLTIMTTSEY